MLELWLFSQSDRTADRAADGRPAPAGRTDPFSSPASSGPTPPADSAPAASPPADDADPPA